MNRSTKLLSASMVAVLTAAVFAASSTPAEAGKQVFAAATISSTSMAPQHPDEPGVIAASSKRVKSMRQFTAVALPNDGVIRMVTRVCGTAGNWRSVAADNSINPPAYIVRLGQQVTINCASTTTPVESPQSSSPAPAVVAASQGTTGWTHPLPGSSLSSCYGMRWGALHRGLDMAAGTGTPIHAAAAGTVVAVGWIYDGYGISVVIDHGNNIYTHYAHQSSTAVYEGQWVNAGDVIGYVGSTGHVTGPHLHFEVAEGMPWRNGNGATQFEPAQWLRDHGVGTGC